MRDWAKTGRSGRYAPQGIGDLAPGMSAVDVPVRAAVFERDWLAPCSSLHDLLSRLPHSHPRIATFDDRMLGVRADHFAWMKSPAAVAAWFSP